MHDVKRKQGDTYPIQATIRDPRGRAFDLTGAIGFTLGISTKPVSDASKAEDAEVKLSGTIDNAAKGTVSFPVSQQAADLAVGHYFAEIQFTHPGGIYTTETFSYQVEGQIVTA